MKNVQWLVITAAIIGLVVKLIKTDKFDALLARLGLPSVPSRYLPWIAVVLGVISGGIQIYLDPTTDIGTLVTDLLSGLLSGAAPIAAHELGTNRDAQ